MKQLNLKFSLLTLLSLLFLTNSICGQNQFCASKEKHTELMNTNSSYAQKYTQAQTIMQNANTKDFLWDVAETIVLITECMTLEPGDVVITGTPAGVGYARTPPVFMKPGDICEIEIENIGILRNSIQDQDYAIKIT